MLNVKRISEIVLRTRDGVLRSRTVGGCVDGNGMVSSQDIRLIARLAALKLTLLPVLEEFCTIVPLPLGICQHCDPIIRWNVGAGPALPKMHMLVAAVSNTLKRCSARLQVYFAWTRTARI